MKTISYNRDLINSIIEEEGRIIIYFKDEKSHNDVFEASKVKIELF